MDNIKVEGVLVFNNETRNEMLKKNLGKYSQWQGQLIPAIGEAYDIPEYNPLHSSTDDKGLFMFTHDDKSEYSKTINKKYFQNDKEKDTYTYKPLTYGELNPWVAFQGGDYIQYIDEVLGKDVVTQQAEYINNLLAGTYIENALRQTEVGVIKNIDVSASLQGAMVTNPNNMSGKDTTLGMLTNQLYARSLYNGAIFNSDREKAKIKVGGFYYNKQYITPYLVNQYGNNLANVMELGDILRIDTNETGIREDLGADVKIIDSVEKSENADKTNSGLRYLRAQIEEAIKYGGERKYSNRAYTPYDGEGYVNGFKQPNEPIYNFSAEIDTYISQPTYTEGVNSKNNNNFSGVDYASKGVYNTYNEGDVVTSARPDNSDENKINQFENYENLGVQNEGLLSKTNELFNSHQIDTLIGRFHTGVSNLEFTDTAKSKYGNSHGRNLLVRNSSSKAPTNGYDNPYCRVWTYHHQYNQIKKLIRPFVKEEGEMIRPLRVGEIQSLNQRYRAYRTDKNDNVIDGGVTLGENTVLQDNGFVRITPHKGDSTKGLKDCMFSIENLAWKDVLDHESNLSKEQRGPNGGRIMWFPPYDLDFQESVNVNWNENSFIGRGEKVYTYTDTTRSGTLSFTLLIDHPSIMNSAAYSSGKDNTDGIDPNADILRFFAGCEMLGEESEDEKKKKIKPKKPPKQKRVPERKEIRFKVFFPNNFSGVFGEKYNGSTTGNILKQWDNLVPYTQDFNSLGLETTDLWWWYLLCGHNTTIPKNVSDYRGYEMKEGQGISDDNAFTDNLIPSCKNYEGKYGYTIGKSGCDETLGTNPEKYYYQVDEDLRQTLIGDEYKDTASSSLNSKLSDTSDENLYTFTEVVVAMLQSSSNKYKDFIKREEIANYLKDFCREDKVKELVKIFTGDDVTFDSLTFIGSADENDKKNANMLAHRRALNVAAMVKRILHEQIKEDIPVKENGDTGGKAGQSCSNIDNKKARCCDFSILCTVGKAEEIEVAGEATPIEGEDGETEGLTFEQYYDIICKYSDVINFYNTGLSSRISEKIKGVVKSQVWNDSKKDLDIEIFPDGTFNPDAYENLLNEVYNIIDLVHKDFLEISYTYYDNTPNSFRAALQNQYNGLIDYTNLDYDSTVSHFIYSGTEIDSVTGETVGNNYTGGHYPLRDINYDEFGNEREEGEDSPSYTFDIVKVTTHYILIRFITAKYSDYADYYDILWQQLQQKKYSGSVSYQEYLMGLVSYISTGQVTTEEGIIEIYAQMMKVLDDSSFNQEFFETIKRIEEAQKKDDAEAEKQRIEQQAREEEEKKRRFNNNVVYGLDTLSEGNIPDNRYESEADYFKSLEVTDPILFKKLTDKFKYFNPAFHSLSPEGFNARLTFLQQCTRQGMTSETRGDGRGNNENGGIQTRTAANLAFGRMPVCVLRIGDFIHTKVIIQSMSINYSAQDGMQWDLNPEGAGVQPMFAKVSLQITLLGGQSLGAPISRLQNAISFNYYANTESYDNRSDVARYNKDNSSSDKRIDNIEYQRIWTPLEGTGEMVEYNGKQVDKAIMEYEEAHKDDASWNTWSDEKGEKAFEKQSSGSTSGDTQDTKYESDVPSQEPTEEFIYNGYYTNEVNDDLSFFQTVQNYYDGVLPYARIYVSDINNTNILVEVINGTLKPGVSEEEALDIIGRKAREVIGI